MASKDNSVQVTQSFATVISGAVGATLSPTQLAAISRGSVELVGGCIRHLFYSSSSKKLDYVRFDGGAALSSSTSANLDDFQEGFECAAKYNFRATICRDKESGRLSMLNLYPCECECRDGKSQRAG